MNRDLQANEAESTLNTDEKDLYLDPNVTRSFDYQRHRHIMVILIIYAYMH